MSFLETAFETAVVFSAIDRLTPAMSKMTPAMKSFQKDIDKIQETIDFSKKLVGAGIAIQQFGNTLEGALDKASDKAAKLQTNLKSLQITIGSNTADMQKYKNMALDISLPTVYSQANVLKNMQLLAAGGINDPTRLKAATKSATNLAEVTELQTHGQVTSDETVQDFLGMAHQFNLQSPIQLAGFADQLAKIQLTSTAKIPQLAETLKYLAPYMNLLGGKPEDALKATAMMSRMGIEGSVAGTHLKDFYERLTPGLLRGGMANEEMYKLGWLKDAKTHVTSAGKLKVDSYSGDIFHNKDGSVIPFVDVMKELIKTTKEHGLNYENLLRPMVHIFGQQGADVASILSSSTGIESLQKIINSTNTMPGLEKQIKDYRNTYEGQQKLMQSNLENLSTQFGQDVNDFRIKFLGPFNILLTDVLKFTREHPNLVGAIAGFAQVLAGLAITVGPLITFIGAIKGLAAIKDLTAVIKAAKAAEAAASAGATETAATSAASTAATTLSSTAAASSVMSTGALSSLASLSITAAPVALSLPIIMHWDLSKKLMGESIDSGKKEIGAVLSGKVNVKKAATMNLFGLLKGVFGGHSEGGIFGKEHLAMFAEGDKEEAAIPLQGNRNRALSIYNQVGEELGVNNGPVIINIYPHPHQNTDEIAKKVIKKLGRKSRNKSMARTSQATLQW